MKCILRMGVLFAAAFLLQGVADTVQAQKILNQLDRNAFVQPELQTIDDFQQMVQQMLPGLQKGFQMAEATDLFDGFVSRVEQTDIEIIEVPPGNDLLWMIFIKGQGVDVLRNVVRAGKDPFKAFVVTVEKDGYLHVFVVPAICGNLGLARIIPLSRSASVAMKSAQAKPPVVAAPAVVKPPDSTTSGGEKRYKKVVPAGSLNGRGG